MAYTDDAVKAKLSALNETQESIVTVAQWVMFHRYRQLSNFERQYDILTIILQETRRPYRHSLA